MRLAILLLMLVVASPAWAGVPKPSGPLKAYKGPEGQVVVMILVDDDKRMLIHLRGIGGDLEGRTLLYDVNAMGNGKTDVFVNKKRGSKTYRSLILTQRDGEWEFYHPTKNNTSFGIYYSEKESEKYKIDDVMKAYKP
ncbi:MAG: hypothetical protein HOV81_39965 [Kofleriaceae bacterium]|nr:hypothetical protein [Kofleriaceae bacterium]